MVDGAFPSLEPVVHQSARFVVLSSQFRLPRVRIVTVSSTFAHLSNFLNSLGSSKHSSSSLVGFEVRCLHASNRELHRVATWSRLLSRTCRPCVQTVPCSPRVKVSPRKRVCRSPCGAVQPVGISQNSCPSPSFFPRVIRKGERSRSEAFEQNARSGTCWSAIKDLGVIGRMAKFLPCFFFRDTTRMAVVQAPRPTLEKAQNVSTTKILHIANDHVPCGGGKVSSPNEDLQGIPTQVTTVESQTRVA